MSALPEYHLLTDDELLHIAEDRDNLTDEARQALDAELSSRKLSSADIDTFRVGREEVEKADQVRRAKATYSLDNGVVKKFLGKANRRRDPGGSFEEYESTLWFVVLWFPVFPIATFTVRREITRWLGIEWKGLEVAKQRHPRNWEQILLTWIEAVAVLWAIRLAFLLVRYHPEWFKHM
jgi:hypothetical protein